MFRNYDILLDLVRGIRRDLTQLQAQQDDARAALRSFSSALGQVQTVLELAPGENHPKHWQPTFDPRTTARVMGRMAKDRTGPPRHTPHAPHWHYASRVARNPVEQEVLADGIRRGTVRRDGALVALAWRICGLAAEPAPDAAQAQPEASGG